MEKKKINVDDISLDEIIGGSPVRPTALSKPGNDSESIQPSQPDKETELPELIQSDKSEKKSVSTKQRKNDLSEYRETFLKVPKIIDRKNVFVSNSTREMIVGIVRLFGSEKTSVSGFLENLVLHHFDAYSDDFEIWKRLLLSKSNQ